MVKRTKRNLKSGSYQTGATSVKRWITWPLKVIYGVDGQPAATYKDLSVSAFVRGYLILLTSKQDSQVKEHMVFHLEDLVEDIDVYCWEIVRAFHATWMN